VDEEAFVSNVEWLCYGCGGLQQSGSLQQAKQQLRKVAGFGGDGPRLTLLPLPHLQQQQRVRLHPGDYELQFWPLRVDDEGDYFCLVNGRDRPTVVNRLLVQGELNVLDVSGA
jgi:hypothetical protein